VILDVPDRAAVAVAVTADETLMQLEVDVRRDAAVAEDVLAIPVRAEVEARLEVPVAVQVPEMLDTVDVPVCDSWFSASGKKKALKTVVLTGSSLYQLTFGLIPSAHSGLNPLTLIGLALGDYHLATYCCSASTISKPYELRNGVVI
jgi:hypothetical protein